MQSRLFERESGQRRSLFGHGDDVAFVKRLDVLAKLEGHAGCVNALNFVSGSKFLLSSGDDKQVRVWDTCSLSCKVVLDTVHVKNVFGVCGLDAPSWNTGGGGLVASCSSDGVVQVTDSVANTCLRMWDLSSPGYRVVPSVERGKSCFLGCFGDGHIKLFDLRSPDPVTMFAWKLNGRSSSASAVDTHPTLPHMFASGCSDSICGIHDMRYPAPWPVQRWVPPQLLHRNTGSKVTSVNFHSSGDSLLANYVGHPLCQFPLIHTIDKSAASAQNEAKYQVFSSLAGKSFSSSRFRVLPTVRIRGDWQDTGPRSHDPARTRRGNSHLTRILSSQAQKCVHSMMQQTAKQEAADTIIKGWRSFKATGTASTSIRRLWLRVQASPSVQYQGHRNIVTVKEARYVGPCTEVVASGSDDGRLYFWRRASGELLAAPEIDGCVVNCVVNGSCNGMIAASGIDHSVKILAPMRTTDFHFSDDVKRAIEYNKRHMSEPDGAGVLSLPLPHAISLLRHNQEQLEMQQQEQADDSDTPEHGRDEPGSTATRPRRREGRPPGCSSQ